MAAQKVAVRRPESQGGGFKECYWRPVNSPLLGDDGQVQFVVHRVEDVSELAELRRADAEQKRLIDELRIRADSMKAEFFLRDLQPAESQRLMVDGRR